MTSRHGRCSRRSVARAGAGLAAMAALGGVGRWPGATAAQGLSGRVSVGFDASNDVLAQVVAAAARSVREANPEAEIEITEAPAGNYQTQLFLALATGRAPDVFITTGLGIGELGAGGYLAPLDPYLEGWEGWSQYSDKVRGAISYGGSVWALPTRLDTHFLYYRKDIFEEAGLGRDWVPGSLDDVPAAARAVKAAVPDVMPYALFAGASGGNATAARGFLPLAVAFGGSLLDEEGRWIIDSCPIRDALRYYETVYQVDETVPQEVMTSPNPSEMVRDAFGAGELAMLFEGAWVYADWEAADAEATASEIGYVQMPMADGSGTFNLGGLSSSWYLNAKAEHTDLAWALIAAGNTKEALVALSLGSPHLPPRQDAADDPAFQETPFLSTMIAGYDDLILAPADPSYRQLVTVIQNATGIVATGEASPDEAVGRYAEEMTRILGEDRVVRQPCER